MKVVRCAFSKEDLVRQFQGRNTQDEFVACFTKSGGPFHPGVIVLRDGTVTDRYEDGTPIEETEMGQTFRNMADDTETLYNPKNESCAGTWLDVVVDDEGNVLDRAIQVGMKFYHNSTSPLESITEFTAVIDTAEAVEKAAEMFLAAQALTNADGLRREIVIPVTSLRSQ